MSHAVILPLPPSANGMFKNVRHGRAKTKTYRQWIFNAGWDLKVSAKWRVPGAVMVFVAVPLNMPGDVDNRAKAILDLLVTHQRIDDDRHVQSVSVTRSPDVAAKTCRVVVESAAKAAA